MRFLVFIAILSLILSCSEKKSEEKVEKMKSLTKEKIIERAFVKVCEIQGGEKYINPRSAALDSKKNIYILDREGSKIIKYFKNGEYQLTFGQKGKGPGEMMRPGNLLIDNDTIFVTDFRERCLHLFTDSGVFIAKKTLQNNFRPADFYSFGKHGYVATVFNRKREDGSIYFQNSLLLLNKELGMVKEFYAHTEKASGERGRFRMDTHHLVITGNDFIYQNIVSETNYKLTIYDSKGEKKAEVTRRYTPVEYEEQEHDKFFERFAGRNLTEEAKKRILKSRGKRKNSIEKLYFNHSQQELWVERAKQGASLNERYLDVFKDFKYIGTFIIKADYNDKLIVDKGCLLVISAENSLVTIYKEASI